MLVDKNRAIRINVITSVITLLFQLVTISFVSYSIDDNAIGVYGLYLAILSIGVFLCEMGVSTSIIKLGWKSKLQLTQLMLFNLVLSFCISLLLYHFSDIFEAYFKAVDLSIFIKLISVAIFFSSMSRFFIAIYSYELKLVFIAKVDFFTKLFSLTFSLGYLVFFESMLGFAYSQIILFLMQLLVYLWHINFVKYFSFESGDWLIKEHVKFGLERTVEAGTSQLSQNIDAFIIAKVFGLDILGVYTIIKQIVLKPLQVINPIFIKVNLPLMCKIEKFDTLRSNYVDICANLFFIAMFILLLSVFIIGGGVLPIIKISLENQLLFYTLMCFWGALRSITSPIGMLYIATKNNRLGIKFNFLSMFIIIFLIIAFSYINQSLEVLAGALVISQCLILTLQHLIILKFKIVDLVFLLTKKYVSIFVVIFYFLLVLSVSQNIEGITFFWKYLTSTVAMVALVVLTLYKIKDETLLNLYSLVKKNA